jgi:hypothetical protein
VPESSGASSTSYRSRRVCLVKAGSQAAANHFRRALKQKVRNSRRNLPGVAEPKFAAGNNAGDDPLPPKTSASTIEFESSLTGRLVEIRERQVVGGQRICSSSPSLKDLTTAARFPFDGWRNGLAARIEPGETLLVAFEPDDRQYEAARIDDVQKRGASRGSGVAGRKSC